MQKAVSVVVAGIVLLSIPGFCKSPPQAQTSSSNNAVKAVTINGKLLSTDIKVVNGKAYVPVAELAKVLGMSLQMDTQTGTLMLIGGGTVEIEEGGVVVAKEALRALETLRSVVGDGVSYSDYRQRKLDAKIVVDRFLREYKEHPAADAISEAMYHYSMAALFWEFYNLVGKDNYLPLSKADDYVKLYPQIEEEVVIFAWGKEVHFLSALSIIWGKASESIDKAISILK